MNQTETDVSSLVDAVADEAECISSGAGTCEGKNAAYGIGHGCMGGFICAAHFKQYVDVHRPKLRAHFQEFGAIRCPQCKDTFNDLDVYSKVYPL